MGNSYALEGVCDLILTYYGTVQKEKQFKRWLQMILVLLYQTKK